MEKCISVDWGGEGCQDVPSDLHQTSAPQPSALLVQQSRPKPPDPELALLEQARICT